MHLNKITSFLLFILTSFSFVLIFLMRTVDFEKNNLYSAMQLGFLLAFQNLQDANYIFKMAASIGLK